MGAFPGLDGASLDSRSIRARSRAVERNRSSSFVRSFFYRSFEPRRPSLARGMWSRCWPSRAPASRATPREDEATGDGTREGKTKNDTRARGATPRALTRSDSAREREEASGTVARSLSRASSARRETREDERGEREERRERKVSFAATIETTIDDEEEDEDAGTGAGAGPGPGPGTRRRGGGGGGARREARTRETTAREAASGTRPVWASKAPPILSRDIFPGASVG